MAEKGILRQYMSTAGVLKMGGVRAHSCPDRKDSSETATDDGEGTGMGKTPRTEGGSRREADGLPWQGSVGEGNF